LVARHRNPGTSGVPTLWQEGPLAEAGNPDYVEGKTPPPPPNVASFALATNIFIDHASIISKISFLDAEVDDDVADGDYVEGKTPPLRRMLHHLRFPRTFLLTKLPFR